MVEALKGRHKMVRRAARVVSTFQGLAQRGTPTQGIALGWLVFGPLALNRGWQIDATMT